MSENPVAVTQADRDGAPGGGEAATLVRAALHDADDISERIVAGGYRGNVSDTETLRNHVRKLAAALAKPTPPASVSGEVVVVPREPTDELLAALRWEGCLISEAGLRKAYSRLIAYMDGGAS